jgi:hypothetical protein
MIDHHHHTIFGSFDLMFDEVTLVTVRRHLGSATPFCSINEVK